MTSDFRDDASSVNVQALLGQKAQVVISELLKAIQGDAEEQCQLTFSERAARNGGAFFPSFIWTEDGEIPIGERGLAALSELKASIREQLTWVDARHEPESLSTAVKSAAGAALLAVSRGGVGADLAPAFVSALERELRGAQADIEWLVPCHVFPQDEEVGRFDVGPVEFWPRREWLARTNSPIEKGVISDYWAEKLSRSDLDAWAGQSESPVRVRMATMEVAKLLVRHPWVAAVPVPDHETRRSERKANAMAVMALNVIALACGPVNAASLVAAGHERRAFRRDRLGFTRSGDAVGGTSSDMLGVSGEAGFASRFLRDWRIPLQEMGALLSSYLDASGKRSVAGLLERWIDALYWFGLAAREPLDFMALIAYGNAIDIASGAGGNLNYLARFAQAVLGHDQNKPIRNDGTTLRSALHEIYNLRRSVYSHGDKSGLLADSRSERRLAHELARFILMGAAKRLSVVVAESYAMLELKKRDADEQFLKWIENEFNRRGSVDI